jgi:glyoxylase-like metal-dependent hydrolase (beta-lactamase superfamily II)
MKLNDDVYVLALPMTFNGQTRQLNLTLIVDEMHGPTLIDTGLPGQSGAIDAALAEAGLHVPDLRRIILTHQDIDHIGSLHALVQESGAHVLAHAIEAPYLEGTLPHYKLTPALLEQHPQLRAAVERLQPTPVDEPLQDNRRLDLAGGVRVIFTPGHTPGHISLYLERSKTLISGDALTADEGQVRGPNAQATPDLALAWQSVRKLAALDVQTIICYHGGVVRDDAGGQLERLTQEDPTAPRAE